MAARGHGAARRWGLVATGIAVLVALPLVLRALPAADADVPAADLRTAALASADVGFSGYAVSAGALALPVSRELPRIADLFSERTTMRVWWRGPEDHRVDVLTPAGETARYRDQFGFWTWDYESGIATRGAANPLALPAAADLLPSSLGRRLLSEAAPGELSRIGARRVAGTDALGLRLTPAERAASVGRVDVWVDPASGLPVQVEVFAAGADVAALDTRFLDLELATPPAAVVEFTPPPGALVAPAPDVEGLLSEAQRRLPPAPLRDQLAGLARRTQPDVPRAVGVYGRGITLLVVIPVPGDLAVDLRRAIAGAPQAVTDALGSRTVAGPLGLMVVDTPGLGVYVLAGTVTLDGLAEAARGLPAAPP